MIAALAPVTGGGASAGRPVRVTVPDVARLDLFTAYQRLRHAGLRVTVGPWSYSTLNGSPRVRRQVPGPGASAAKGSGVVLELGGRPIGSPVGTGYTGVMPSFIGKPPNEGIAWARSARLYAAVAAGAIRGGDAADYWGNLLVTAQDPAPGTGTESALTVVLTTRQRR